MNDYRNDNENNEPPSSAIISEREHGNEVDKIPDASSTSEKLLVKPYGNGYRVSSGFANELAEAALRKTKTRQWGTKSKRFITGVLHKALHKTGHCCLLTLCILSVCIMYHLFTVPQKFERGERSAVGCGQNKSEILLLACEDAGKMNQLRRKLSLESPICYEEHYSDIFVNFTAHRISSIKNHLNLHVSKGGGTSFCKLAYNAQKVEQKLANRNCWEEKHFRPLWLHNPDFVKGDRKEWLGKNNNTASCQMIDSKLPPFIMNENYLDYPLCTSKRLYSVLLRDPIERVKSHEKYFDEYIGKGDPHKEEKRQLIRNNYITWTLAAGITGHGNRVSLIPRREHLEIAMETLAQFDFLLELTNNHTCTNITLNLMGFSGHELLHSNADKGGKKVLIESDTKFREWNQLDIELYDYAQRLMQVDCEFFLRVERAIYGDNSTVSKGTETKGDVDTVGCGKHEKNGKCDTFWHAYRRYQEIMWKKDGVVYQGIPDSAKQFVKRLDDTFLLAFPSIKKRALIGSAIQVPEENMVAFIVVDNPNGEVHLTDEIKREELPDGMLCAFGSHQSSQTLDEFIASTTNGTATSPLKVYANRLQYYKSSSIWSCPLPNNGKEFDYVAILTPSSVKVMAGTGVFHIQRPDIYERRGNSTSSLVTCVARSILDLYGHNNRTADDLKTYINYYRRLGVQHFIMFASENNDKVGIGASLNDLLSIFQEVNLPGGGSTLSLYLLPSSQAHELSNYFTVNHCLYTARNADWILGQYDLDEILVGTQHLPTYLSSQPESVKALRVRHYLPKEDKFAQGGKELPLVHVSSHRMDKWGKTIYRPKHVNVSWVHAPTNPRLKLENPEDLKLLHFRRDKSQLMTYFHKQNMTWVEETLWGTSSIKTGKNRSWINKRFNRRVNETKKLKSN